MSGAYHLGDNGKYGTIDLSKLRNGITVEEFARKCNADDALRNLFIQFAGEDGVLSQDEIKGTLTQYLSGAAGDDGIISDNEGRKIKNSAGKNIGKQGREQLFKFLAALQSFTDDVSSISYDENNTETITYNDGHVEITDENGQKKIITEKNGIKTTVYYDKNGEVIGSKEFDQTLNINTSKGKDGVIQKRELRDGRIVEIYKDGKLSTITTQEDDGSTTVKTYTGEDAYTITNTKQDGTIQQYDCIYKDEKLSVNQDTKIVKQDNKTLKTVTQNDAQRGNIVEEFVDDKITSQTIQGRTVRYDENGNTMGIIVQNGESVALLAKRFGVDVKDIVELNKSQIKYTKGGKPYFKVGAEIVIPGKVEADAEVFNGRKSKREAIEEFNIAWRESQAKKAEAERQALQQKPAQAVLEQFGGKDKLLEIKFPTKNNPDNKFKYALDSDGNVWFYDSDGNWLGEEKQTTIVNVLANSVVGMIKIKSPAGIVNEGIKGDFPDNIKKAIEPYILSKDILDAVNEQLKQEGYNKSIQMPKSVAKYIKKHTSKPAGNTLNEDIVNKNIPDAGKKIAINGKEYTITGQNGWGEYVLDDGNGTIAYAVKNEKDEYSIVDNDYRDARTNGKKGVYNKSAFGNRYTIVNGKVYYLDDQNNVITDESARAACINNDAANIAQNILCADSLSGWNTDTKKLTKALEAIYSNEVFEAVNTHIQSIRKYSSVAKGQKTAIEQFLINEESHEEVRNYFRILINNGVLTNEQIADYVINEFEWAGKTARRSTEYDIMRLVTNSEVRKLVETRMGNHCETENKNDFARQYLKSKGYGEKAVEMIMAKWVESNAYKEGYWTESQEGDTEAIFNEATGMYYHPAEQLRRNEIIGNLLKFDDMDCFKAALDACDSREESADYAYLSGHARAEINGNPKKYTERFQGQSDVQRYIAGRCANLNNEVRADELWECNTYLYTGERPEKVKAEEAFYKIANGDYAAAFDDTFNEETYKILNEMLASGQLECKDLRAVYNKAKAQCLEGKTNNDIDKSIRTGKWTNYEYAKLITNAMCSEQLNPEYNELLETGKYLLACLSQYKYGQNVTSAYAFKDQMDQSELELKNLLSHHPEIANDLKAFIQDAYNNRKSNVWEDLAEVDFCNKETSMLPVYIKLIDSYSKYEKKADTPKFFDELGREITAPDEIAVINENRRAQINNIRKYVGELERAYNISLIDMGGLSEATDIFMQGISWGTSSEDVKRNYTDMRRLLSQLEIAAEGKLYKDGKNVSMEDLVTEFLKKEFGLSESDSVEDLQKAIINKLQQAGSNNAQSVGVGKMVLTLLPVIIATVAVTEGAALEGWAAVFAAAGTAATTTATIGAVDVAYKDSYDKADAWQQVGEDSLVAAVATLAGGAEMKLITSIGGKSLFAVGGKFILAISGDAASSAVIEMSTTGQVTTEGMVTCLVLSAAGNVIGYKQFKKAPNGKMVEVNSEQITGGEAASGTKVLDKTTKNPTSTTKVEHPGKVKVGSDKANAIKVEIDNAVNDSNMTADRLVDLYRKADALNDNKLRVELQNKLDVAASKLLAEEHAAYKAKKLENLNAEVERIFNSGNEIGKPEVRKFEEYINELNTVEEIKAFEKRLAERTSNSQGKKALHMTTDDYNALIDKANNKIKAIKRANAEATRTLQEKHDHAIELLRKVNEDGSSKGISAEDLKEINRYIAEETDSAKLDDIARALNKNKKIGMNERKSIKDNIKNQRDKINNANKPQDTPPAEQPKPVQEEKPVDMLDAMKEESRKTRNMEPEDGVALKEEQVYPKDNSEANPKKSVSDEVKPVEAEQPELVKPVEAPKEPAATAKPYSEMSEQELLAEYKKLYNDNTKDFGQNFDNEYRKGVIRDELKDRGVYIDEEGNVFSRTSVETNKPVTEEPVEANPNQSVSDEVKPVETVQPEPVKPVETPKEPAATTKPEPIKVPTEKEIKAITDANKLLEEYNNLRKLPDDKVITKAEYKQIEKRLSQIEKRLKKDFKKQIGKDGKLEDIPEKTTNKKPAEKKVENTDNSKSQNVKKMDETELTNEYNDLKNKLQESDITQEAKTKYENRIKEIEEAFANRGYTMVEGHPSLPSKTKLQEMSPDDLAALYNKCKNIKDKTARNQYRHQIEDVLDKQGYKMRRDGVVDKHSFRTGFFNYKKTTGGQKNIGLLSSKTLSIGPEITGGKRAWELNSPWFFSESLPLRIGRGIDGYDGLTISIGTGGDFDAFTGINIRFGGKGSSGTRVNGDFFGMFGKKRAQKASQRQQVAPDVPSNPETPVVNSKKSQPMGLNSADQITPHEFSKGTKQERVTSKPKDYESKMAELKSKYPKARDISYDQTEHEYVVRSDEITYVYSEGGTLKMTDQTNHAKNVRTYNYLKEDGITSDYRVDYDYKNKIGIVYDGQTKIAEINYKKNCTTVTKYDTLGKVISSQDYGSGEIKVNETYVKQLVDDARKTRVNEQPVVHENPQKLNDTQEHKVTKEGNITSVYYGDRKIVEIIDYGPEQGITIKELYKNVTRVNLSIDPNPTQVQIKKWLEEAKRSFEL